MINLLPRDLAHQLAFAKANAKLVRYVQLTGAVIVILSGVFGGGVYFLSRQTQSVEANLAATRTEIASYTKFEKEARGMADRLGAIKKIEADQTRFSLLLSDIAAVLPRNVVLQGITLTGDAQKPVRVTMSASSYDAAVGARNAIASSERIAGADLESVTQNDRGYQALVTLAFKPGKAR